MDKTHTILIVEDDLVLISTLSIIFRNAGYNILTAENGEKAIALFKKNQPDIILLDLNLPDIHGIEVLRRIKQMDITTPIIICSATFDTKLAVASMKYGAYDYISKPFDAEKMIKIASKALMEPSVKLKIGKKIRSFEKRAGLDRRKDWTDETETKNKKKKILIWLIISALVITSVIFLLFLKSILSHKEEQRVFYKTPYAHPTALARGKDGSLWVSDWYKQYIYQHKLSDDSLPLIKAYNIPNSCITGLTFGREYLWSCDSVEKKIHAHILDDNLSIIKSYSSPGTSPSGLFFDGQNLWSCDNDTCIIYKHAIDDELSVIDIYNSPGSNPVGICGEGKNIYSADADMGEIYKHKLDERLSVVHTYKLDIFPRKIAGITYDGKYIWISIEKEAKIYRYNLNELQK